MLNVKLKSATFKNCQSLEDITLEFGPGLNVIKALKNNTGKSVMWKMNKIAGHPNKYSRADRKDLIRGRSEFAEATYRFTDNSCGIVRVWKSSVEYYYTPQENEVPFAGTTFPDQEFLNRMSLLVDREREYVGNVLDDLEGHILVDGSTEGSRNLMKIATEHPKLESLKILCAEKIKTYRDREKDAAAFAKHLRNEYQKRAYVDVGSMKSRADILRKFLPIYRSLVGGYKSLSPGIKVKEDLSHLWNMSEVFSKLVENFSGIRKEFPKDVREDLIAVSEILMGLGQLAVASEMPRNLDTLWETALKLTGGLENLNVPFPIEEEDRVPLSQVLMSLTELKVDSGLIRRLELLSEEKEYLEDQIKDGVKYPCPIYGEVTHINEVCIPTDNRFARQGS